ncbi:MAG: reverse transcriptase-like protein, partial [Candidatus Thorarchaeota archaeon]|nr:reverse transcriptase-like protein [Candidatus Thorarchaeota archaeon]
MEVPDEKDLWDEMIEEEMDMIRIWTDGACSGNPGPGGWAYLIKFELDGAQVEMIKDGGERESTNIRMEYMAILRALETLSSWPLLGREEIFVYSDCEMVIRCITGEYRKCTSETSREFLPQIGEVVERIGAYLVSFKHIRGHAGLMNNERVNRMAQDAIRRLS